MEQCHICKKKFKTINERDSHTRRSCRLTYALQLEDGSIKIIKRSKDKKFHCPVSTCETSVQRGDSLGTHYKVHWKKSKDAAPCTTEKDTSFCIIPDVTATPELLRNANLCIVHHSNLVLLMCMTCNKALQQRTSKAIRKHVKKHGDIRRHSCLIGDQPTCKVVVPQLQELSSVLSSLLFTSNNNEELQPYMTDIQAELLAPVPGVMIERGFSCQKCIYFCAAKRSMDNHRWKFHEESPISEVSSRCQVQTLPSSATRKFYGVQEKSLYGTNDLDVQSIQEQIREEFKNHTEILQEGHSPAIEAVTPWLRRSLWHEMAKGFMPEGIPFLEVKAQIIMPSKDDNDPLFYVAALVLKYMNQVQDFLTKNQLDYTLRQMVKKDGFYQLLRKDSVKKYNEVMTLLLLSLLRGYNSTTGSGSGNFIIRPTQEDLVSALQELTIQLSELNDDNIDDADISVLHKVMLVLWTPKIPEILSPCKSSDCLFTRFLILDAAQQISKDVKSTLYKFQAVKVQTQIFAKLQYWARATILMELAQRVWHTNPKDIMVDDIQHLCKYVTDDVYGTPWTSIAQFMKLAKTVAMNEPMKPKIFMCDDSSTAGEMDGEQIDVTMMQNMVRNIAEQAHTIMKNDVLLGLGTEWIDIHLKKKAPIYDEINSCEPLYSFLTDSRNYIFEDHRKDLVEHLFFSRMTASLFLKGRSDKGELLWNLDALRRWMAACSKLQELLLLLVHFTASLPSRGEEYRSLLLKNTTTGDRSFHWRGGQLMIFQSYHKGANCDAPMKLISKYLPKKFSALYLKDFCLVRPTQSYIAKILWSEEASALYQDCWFIDMGKRLCGEDLSNSIRRAFREHCGFTYNMSQYRQIATFFAASIKGEQNKSLLVLLDEAGGHTSTTVDMNYAKTNRDYRYLATNEDRGYRLVSALWHNLYDCGDSEATESDCGDISQATETLQVSRRKRLISHPCPGLSVEYIYPYKKTKVNCIFDVSEDSDCYKKEEKESDPLKLISAESARKARACLPRFQHSTWKSAQQATAVALSIENATHFVAILPTGGGKSLIYMAPAILTTKTIIVVVPLQTLVTSHVQDCRRAGIPCAIYDDKVEVSRSPSILFVSIEVAAQSEKFGIFSSQLKLADRLHSIVLDEVHLLLCEYRPVMKRLLHLVMLDCQIIGLTASLSPTKQQTINIMLALEMVWIRAPTVRPNLRYIVTEATDIDVEIEHRLSIWSSKKSCVDDRAIVYCFTCKEVEDLAKKLIGQNFACTYMHAQFTKDAKQKSLESWESGKTKIMVATGVIGTGYNYKSVRLVLHRGTVRSLDQFHQESGRAGRDGLTAECYVISNCAYRANAIQIDHSLGSSHNWMENQTTCRRIKLHGEVDGKYQMCCLIQDAVLCDICAPEYVEGSLQQETTSIPTARTQASQESREQVDLSSESYMEVELPHLNTSESGLHVTAEARTTHVTFQSELFTSTPKTSSPSTAGISLHAMQGSSSFGVLGTSSLATPGESLSATPGTSSSATPRTCSQATQGRVLQVTPTQNTLHHRVSMIDTLETQYPVQAPRHDPEGHGGHNRQYRAPIQNPALINGHNGQCRAPIQNPALSNGHNGQYRATIQNPALIDDNVIVTRVSSAIGRTKQACDVSDLERVRKFAGDGSTCLLCWKSGPCGDEFNHDSKDCPIIRGSSLCIQCLHGKHGGGNCENKIKYLKGVCFRCYFQIDNCWSTKVHIGKYGPGCTDKTGERLRLFIWKAWRDNNLREKLCEKFPQIRNLDENGFAKWIPCKEPSEKLNNFVRIATEIVKITFPEIR